MPECKVLTCCDLDDFQMSSSNEDNCPVGYYWKASRRIDGTPFLNEDGEPFLNLNDLPQTSSNGTCKRIPSNALLNEDGMPFLNEDGEPLLN